MALGAELFFSDNFFNLYLGFFIALLEIRKVPNFLSNKKREIKKSVAMHFSGKARCLPFHLFSFGVCNLQIKEQQCPTDVHFRFRRHRVGSVLQIQTCYF